MDVTEARSLQRCCEARKVVERLITGIPLKDAINFTLSEKDDQLVAVRTNDD